MKCNQNTTARPILRTLALVAAASAIAAPLAGCRGDRTDKPPRQFFPGMDDQQKWDPQEATEFFADGRTTRTPVDGTVAFASETFSPDAMSNSDWAQPFLAERAVFLAEDEIVFTGKSRNAQGEVVYADYIPVQVTQEMLLVGQEKFNIYCAACHGSLGQGAVDDYGPSAKSPVAGRWSNVRNLHLDVYKDRSGKQGKDGYLYEITREGLWNPATGANQMPGYKHALDEMEAWAVVAYLRALQASQSYAWADLPSTEQQRLGQPQPVAQSQQPTTEGGTQ